MALSELDAWPKYLTRSLRGKLSCRPKKIEKLSLRTEYADLPPLVQPHIHFLRDILPRLQAVQHPTRNKVLHIENKLIPVSAEVNEEICWETWTATRALMRKVAVDLPNDF